MRSQGSKYAMHIYALDLQGLFGRRKKIALQRKAIKFMSRQLIDETYLPIGWSVVSDVLEEPLLPEDLEMIWDPLAGSLQTIFRRIILTFSWALAVPTIPTRRW
jgi:hypothetical protein